MTTTTRTLEDGTRMIVTVERHNYRHRVYAYIPGHGNATYIGSLMRPACPENVERMAKGLSRMYRAGFAQSYPAPGKSWESPTLYKTQKPAVDYLVRAAQENGLL